MTPKTSYFIGLISGTSADGIDAVLADLQASPRIEHALTHAYPAEVKQAVDQARDPACRMTAAQWALLDARLGDVFAEAAQALMKAADIAPEQIVAIGSHGQTLSHQPDAEPPATLQLGDPHRIAVRTGITVVADFRRADLAAGGQGAPLAPLIHEILLARSDENRAVLNLGGIANVTWLPAQDSACAFDTGPANCFLDLWYRRHHMWERSCDRDLPEETAAIGPLPQDGDFDAGGQWAAGGQCVEELLQALLDDPYFTRPPPKSTGIEQFDARWLDQRLSGFELNPVDVQATLVELTVTTVAQALEHYSPDRLLVAGGGVHNHYLMRRLGEVLAPLPVQSTADAGVAPDFIEALLFAWLAHERLADNAVNTRPITGAAKPVLLGTIHRIIAC